MYVYYIHTAHSNYFKSLFLRSLSENQIFLQNMKGSNCVKSVQIRSFFWSVFSCRVSLRIQSEYGKIRTRKNSVFEHFSRSVECSDSKLRSNSHILSHYLKQTYFLEILNQLFLRTPERRARYSFLRNMFVCLYIYHILRNFS